jgi:hypothetical protein
MTSSPIHSPTGEIRARSSRRARVLGCADRGSDTTSSQVPSWSLPAGGVACSRLPLVGAGSFRRVAASPRTRLPPPPITRQRTWRRRPSGTSAAPRIAVRSAVRRVAQLGPPGGSRVDVECTTDVPPIRARPTRGRCSAQVGGCAPWRCKQLLPIAEDGGRVGHASCAGSASSPTRGARSTGCTSVRGVADLLAGHPNGQAIMQYRNPCRRGVVGDRPGRAAQRADEARRGRRVQAVAAGDGRPARLDDGRPASRTGRTGLSPRPRRVGPPVPLLA